MDESNEQYENAESSIQDRHELDSNATLASERQLEKQCAQSFVTEEGMARSAAYSMIGHIS
jgi:hypothetical protein